MMGGTSEGGAAAGKTEKNRSRSSYSTKRKYQIIQECASVSKKEVMDKYPGLQRRTLDNWLRKKDEIIQAQESGLRSKKKRNFNDPLKKIKERVVDFLNTNDSLNDNERMVLTGEMIGIKAKMIADELLQQHAQMQTFLSAAELEGISKFQGSAAWGRKFCKDIRYRTANAPPVGESDEESTTEEIRAEQPAAAAEPTTQDSDVLKRGEVKARHMTSFFKAADRLVNVMSRDADFFEDAEALQDLVRRLDRKKKRVAEELKTNETSEPRFSVLSQQGYQSVAIAMQPPPAKAAGVMEMPELHQHQQQHPQHEHHHHAQVATLPQRQHQHQQVMPPSPTVMPTMFDM